MKTKQKGAVAPKKLGREFWLELVEGTLRRPLDGEEHETIIGAYERDCASRILDPGIILGMSFPQIRDASGRGYLEVQATSMASDNYGCEVVDDAEVEWQPVITSCLIQDAKGGR